MALKCAYFDLLCTRPMSDNGESGIEPEDRALETVTKAMTKR